jgi:hypothetical protein
MSITELFKKLGAPLVNSRWSWGSVRELDGAVFLRVWQDRKINEGGHTFLMVSHHEKYEDDPDNRGYKERISHIELVQSGAKCYMINCIAEDVNATPRKIMRFNQSEVFVGGRVVEKFGDVWVELADRIPIEEVIP